MITDITSAQNVQNASTLFAMLNTAIENAATIADPARRASLFNQVVNQFSADDAANARWVSLLLASLDPAELDFLNGRVNIADLRMAGKPLVILSGYLESITAQTDPAVKTQMIEKLIAAFDPARARERAVQNSVVAVEMGPLAF